MPNLQVDGRINPGEKQFLVAEARTLSPAGVRTTPSVTLDSVINDPEVQVRRVGPHLLTVAVGRLAAQAHEALGLGQRQGP